MESFKWENKANRDKIRKKIWMKQGKILFKKYREKKKGSGYKREISNRIEKSLKDLKKKEYQSLSNHKWKVKNYLRKIVEYISPFHINQKIYFCWIFWAYSS